MQLNLQTCACQANNWLICPNNRSKYKLFQIDLFAPLKPATTNRHRSV